MLAGGLATGKSAPGAEWGSDRLFLKNTGIWFAARGFPGRGSFLGFVILRIST